MQQAHLFYSGGRISESATARKIMAFELLDDYHLSPNEIDELPYHKIKEIFLLRRMKAEAHNLRVAKDQFKREQQSGSGGGRRIREV